MVNDARFILGFLFILLPHGAGGEKGVQSQPVAEILGKPVTLQDLDAGPAPGGARASPAGDRDTRQRQREERLRELVWKALFEDYARQKKIAPTPAEIDSYIAHLREFEKQDHLRRDKQRTELIEELRSPSLTEARRKQAQSALDTLNRLKDFDAQRAAELRDPAQQRMEREAQRQVSEEWIRRWKVNQALYREFGGRIIFQQAGCEPIDAYRKLIDSSEAKHQFVLYDPAFRDAVYSYFRHDFVYADEAQAKFYFEKPYWERTDAELKAAGFQ
jgi:hypothetical protein